VRHESFCGDRVAGFLRDHDVALVVADSPHKWPLLEKQTSDFMYLRLHGHQRLYASGYDDAQLDLWAAKARSWLGAGLDVYAYFDNDSLGRAPHDAVALLARLSG
jgi:uncharacterized protein YecE (DUF72 family)